MTYISVFAYCSKENIILCADDVIGIAMRNYFT